MDYVIHPSFKTYDDVLKGTSEWIITGDTMFHWEEKHSIVWLNSFQPTVDHFSMGTSSGLIAYHIMKFGQKMRPKIVQCNPELIPIHEFYVEHQCSSCHPYVFQNDDIYVVTDDGYCARYNGGFFFASFDISSIFQSPIIIMDVAFSETAFAVIESEGRLIISEDYQSFRSVFTFSEAIAKPRFFGLVPKEQSPTGSIIVYIIDDNGELKVFSNNQSCKISFDSPLISASISTTSKYISFIDENLNVMVSNTQLTKIFYEKLIINNGYGDFQSFGWIGDIAPVVGFNGAVVLVADDQEADTFWYVDDNPVIFSDFDAVYIVTKTKSYKLSYISESIVKSFDEGTNSDSSKLCRIFDQHKDFPLDGLFDIDVQNGVLGCLEAAEFSSNYDDQKFFLNAACLGNGFINSKLSDKIAHSIKIIRILNALRKETTSMISAYQFSQINVEIILRRLCSRGLHLLAANIAKLLDMPLKEIGNSYSEYVIQNTQDDNVCYKELENKSFVDFSNASIYAYHFNRIDLAQKLADKDQDYSSKALLFARMEQWTQSFKFAAMSNDSATLFRVITISLGSSLVEEINHIIASSMCTIYFALSLNSKIPIDRMRSIIKSGAEMSEPSIRFGIKYLDPPMYHESAVPFIKGYEFNIKSNDFPIDTPVNTMIGKYALDKNGKTIKALSKACGLDHKRVTLLRLRTLAEKARWPAFIKYAAKKKRKNFYDFSVELLILHKAPENQITNFLNEIAVVLPKESTRLQEMINEQKFGPEKFNLKKAYYGWDSLF